ncbi:hypothetical protein GUITHDRAFT_110007 [Guillardia theta CCMP2712]|uniref:Uncharacterized protein n=1 Tax=Guillardia theta (strain CCMP2712) TaxID=905079 RepID=L1J709_GUITC|nr:hypothetical protein GUITHDRAFT_110007 [Guillardia theta CCMP2712]EKX43889.1 hypothetical protein GUITHDRAFT_110007 [Guillardia theta CCMP2712]|eukprot:XP_005830869.1 hypothetical protein GUITHDRAFT_110007 [Guillardia theta CCMP2712]
MVGRRTRALSASGRRRTEEKTRKEHHDNGKARLAHPQESWDSLSEIWEVSSDQTESVGNGTPDSALAWFAHLTYVLDGKVTELEFCLQTILSRVSVCRCLNATGANDSSSEREASSSGHNLSIIDEMEQQVADVTSDILSEYDEMALSASKLLDVAESMHKSQSKSKQDEKASMELTMIQYEKKNLLSEMEDLRCQTSKMKIQKQLLEKSIDKEKLRAMRAEEAFAIEKRKVATLSTQISSLKEHYASTEIECENMRDQLLTLEEKLRHIRKEAADNKAEMEAAHEKELTALMKKQDQELSASRASWAKKEDHMKAKLKSRRAALTPTAVKELEVEDLGIEVGADHRSRSKRTTESARLPALATHNSTRHQRLLQQAENVQRDLQDELAKAREANESQAFAQHRDSMQRARSQINQQSEELEKLRSEILQLRSELLSEKAKRDQALNEASRERFSLLEEIDKLQRRQERDLRADVEARDKAIAALKQRLQAAEAELEGAKAHEAQAVSKLERELELMRERMTAVGRGELLFQVGNARSMKELEVEMEELRRENLNLKILVGDLERDKAKV